MDPNLDISNISEQRIRAALHLYDVYREGRKRYMKRHPEIARENSKKSYYRIKDDPERYVRYLEVRRNYQRKQREMKKAESATANQQSPQDLGDSNKIDNIADKTI